MKILICSFMTSQVSHRYNFFPKVIGNFNYYVASSVCENFPFDFNLSYLRNECLKAAKLIKADWLVMLSGIDASIEKLPDFTKLNKNVFYYGYHIDASENLKKKFCSNWIISKEIFFDKNFDESYIAYGWEDYDFFYNECNNIEKYLLEDFITFDIKNDIPKLVEKDEFCKQMLDKNKERFLKKYKDLHGYDFVF